MSLNRLHYDLSMLLINKLTCKNFHNLANDLGDSLILLEALYSGSDQDTLKLLYVTKILDDCAKEIDLALKRSRKTILNDVEKALINSLNLIEESTLKL